MKEQGKLSKIFSSFGPGFIVAATVLGPGTITVASKAGVALEYSILWAVIVSAVFMLTFSRVAAKIGVNNSKSLLQIVGDQYGRFWSVLTGIIVFLICGGFQTGNNIGIGMAMESIFGGSIALWAIVFYLLVVFVIWASKDFYAFLENIMIAMVVIMTIAFAVNVFMAKPSIIEITKGIIPSKPKIWGLVIAMSATSFSLAGAAYQSYMVQGKKWTVKDFKTANKDSIVGTCVLCGLTMLIMITSAAVLAPKGVEINSAVDMAIQLEPLLGSFAKWIFLLGLFAASFSSFVSNATLGGLMLSDGLGKGSSVNSKLVKIFTTVLLTLSTLLAVFVGGNPIEALVVAQASTIFGGPIIGILLLLLGNNSNVLPKEYRNSKTTNIICVLGIIWTCYLSYNQIVVFMSN